MYKVHMAPVLSALMDTYEEFNKEQLTFPDFLWCFLLTLTKKSNLMVRRFAGSSIASEPEIHPRILAHYIIIFQWGSIQVMVIEIFKWIIVVNETIKSLPEKKFEQNH